MIEKTVRDHLHAFDGISAYMEIPEDITDREFVVVEKTGGRDVGGIRTATIVVQSYARSLFDSATLNEKVIERMSDIVGVMNVFQCSLNSNYNFTDTKTKRYRYQAVFDLVYKE